MLSRKRSAVITAFVCCAILLQGCTVGNETVASASAVNVSVSGKTGAETTNVISSEAVASTGNDNGQSTNLNIPVVDAGIDAVLDDIEALINTDSYNAVYVAAGDVNSDGNYEVYVSYGSSTYERFLKTQIFVVDSDNATISIPECNGLLINPSSVTDTDEQMQQLQYLRTADGEYLCAFNKDNRLAGVEEMIYCTDDKYTMEEIASFYIYVDESTDESSSGYQLYIEDKNTGEMPVADLAAIEEKYLDDVEERTVANLFWERYDANESDLGALLTESLRNFSTEKDASISLPDYIEVSFDSNEYDAKNKDNLTDEEKEILRRISNLKSQGY